MLWNILVSAAPVLILFLAILAVIRGVRDLRFEDADRIIQQRYRVLAAFHLAAGCCAVLCYCIALSLLLLQLMREA